MATDEPQAAATTAAASQAEPPPPPPSLKAPAAVDNFDLRVDGCKENSALTTSVAGFYKPLPELHHGKTAWKRQVGGWGNSSLIYFWDDRDGWNNSGWWFGPQLGSDTAWLFHPHYNAGKPPGTGWIHQIGFKVDPDLCVKIEKQVDQDQSGLTEQEEEEEEDEVAREFAVMVSACSDPEISAVIAGLYRAVDTHHGKALYQKQPGVGADPESTVLIYFWQDEEIRTQSGWYIAPSVDDWDQVWAFNPSRTASTPPTRGWNVGDNDISVMDASFSVRTQVLRNVESEWHSWLDWYLIESKSCCAGGLAWRETKGHDTLYAWTPRGNGRDMLVQPERYKAWVFNEKLDWEHQSVSERASLNKVLRTSPENSLWMAGERYCVVQRQEITPADSKSFWVVVAKRPKKGVVLAQLEEHVVIGRYDEEVDPLQSETTCKKAVVRFTVECCYSLN